MHRNEVSCHYQQKARIISYSKELSANNISWSTSNNIYSKMIKSFSFSFLIQHQCQIGVKHMVYSAFTAAASNTDNSPVVCVPSFKTLKVWTSCDPIHFHCDLTVRTSVCYALPRTECVNTPPSRPHSFALFDAINYTSVKVWHLASRIWLIFFDIHTFLKWLLGIQYTKSGVDTKGQSTVSSILFHVGTI